MQNKSDHSVGVSWALTLFGVAMGQATLDYVASLCVIASGLCSIGYTLWKWRQNYKKSKQGR